MRYFYRNSRNKIILITPSPHTTYSMVLLLLSMARLGGASASVCMTPSCILQTADLIRQMDRTVQPCQDFYQFACGGMVSSQVVPEHKTKTGELCQLTAVRSKVKGER